MHDELLRVARHLAGQARAAAIPAQEAFLRRAVSTAYYALFHLLTFECASLLSPAHANSLKRGFGHGPMREVSDRFYAGVAQPPAPPGPPITLDVKSVGQVDVPLELANVAWYFVQLYGARHTADYNFAQPVTPLEARAHITGAILAFRHWRRIRTDPAARLYLGLLVTWQEIGKRKN